MSDITIDGGAFGMWVSNQQFTIRRVTITNAVSAIYQARRPPLISFYY